MLLWKIVLLLLVVSFGTHAVPLCLPPYLTCPNGACSIFPDQCSLCTHGQLVCPGNNTCVTDYNQCVLLPFLNKNVTIEDRIKNLLSLLTLEEKVSQLVVPVKAIERLGIPYYNWGHEALHGVAREAGPATAFPQVIGLGSTFDANLIYRIGRAISEESRAKYTKALASGSTDSGITFYAPNINIYRDPRWGRGQETPGEDPYLTSVYVRNYVRGLQEGPDRTYLEAVACCKHYAVYNFDNLTSQNVDRGSFNAVVSEEDLLETYLPAFKACVVDAKGQTAMCSYNEVNGVPTCSSKTLLTDFLRTQWGFDGFVMSDAAAIENVWKTHHFVPTGDEAAIVSISAGCDQELSTTYYNSLVNSVQSGKIDVSVINTAVGNTFRVRFRLGLLDNPWEVSYNYVPYSVVVSPEHTQLALEAAHKSIVLLKNEKNVFPISKNINSIAVIGPNANVSDILLGNYAGNPVEVVTILSGIQTKLNGKKVYYAPGCAEQWCTDKSLFPDAVNAAKSAEVILLIMGIRSCPYDNECWIGRAEIEGEAKDRIFLDLPGYQEDLIEQILSVAGNKPLAVVLVNGGSITMDWLGSVNGLLEVFYPGEQGGTAVADVLFGDYNPGGRLTTTWVKSVSDLPAYTDIGMQGRTYKYFKGTPLFPFGFGLSYSTFDYSSLIIGSNSIKPCDSINIKATLTNLGPLDGDEVVQVYFTLPGSKAALKLVAFERYNLKVNQKISINFTIGYEIMAIASNGVLVINPGTVKVSVGGGQPSNSTLIGNFMITGSVTPISQCT